MSADRLYKLTAPDVCPGAFRVEDAVIRLLVLLVLAALLADIEQQEGL